MELWTAFLLGILGSAHCAGMCGPLVLALSAANRRPSRMVAGKLAYNIGRTLTYAVLGILLGGMGQILGNAQSWLSILAGGGLLIGAAAPFRRGIGAIGVLAGIRGRMSGLLKNGGVFHSLGLGALNGLLPCGLVYAACAGAVSTGRVGASVGYMILFGLGTLPMMLGIGLLGPAWISRMPAAMRRLSPWVTVLMGGLLILRGMGLGLPYVSPNLDLGARACPSCRDSGRP